MEILQAVSNITCDLIKMNKGIDPEKVINFVGSITKTLKQAEDDLPPEIDINDLKIKELRIKFAEDEQ